MQISLTFLVLAYTGCLGKEVIKGCLSNTTLYTFFKKYHHFLLLAFALCSLV